MLPGDQRLAIFGPTGFLTEAAGKSALIIPSLRPFMVLDINEIIYYANNMLALVRAQPIISV